MAEMSSRILVLSGLFLPFYAKPTFFSHSPIVVRGILTFWFYSYSLRVPVTQCHLGCGVIGSRGKGMVKRSQRLISFNNLPDTGAVHEANHLLRCGIAHDSQLSVVQECGFVISRILIPTILEGKKKRCFTTIAQQQHSKEALTKFISANRKRASSFP